jgi:uncharacterized protein
MPWTAALGTALRRLQARLVHLFFGNFFRLLITVVSLSQWGLLWWLRPRFVEALPWSLWLAVPVAIYIFNRYVAPHVRRGQRGTSPARVYYALAFTSLFGMAFLLATGAVWLTAKVFVEAIAVQAWVGSANLAVDSGVDTGFRWVADAGLAAIGVSFAYGYSIGQRQLRVTRLQLPLRNYPAALRGLRIVQISDIHIGQNLDLEQLQGFVAQVNGLRPDLICITGDIIDSPTADIAGSLPTLAQLRATHAVFAILGNHDHYAGGDRVEAALRQLTPFTVLRDQHSSLEVNGERLHVVGLDDRGRDWARGVPAVPYLAAVLEAIPQTEPVLLLCHRPDIFPQAAAGGVALTLSGHTHGGQLGIPWFNGRVRNLAEFITAFDRGLFECDGAYLYVNSGLGVTGQRIRLCTPREITLIEVAPNGADRLAA